MTENFDFSLSFGLPPSGKELRLFKSLIAYINALSRFCLGEKEFVIKTLGILRMS